MTEKFYAVRDLPPLNFTSSTFLKLDIGLYCPQRKVKSHQKYKEKQNNIDLGTSRTQAHQRGYFWDNLA